MTRTLILVKHALPMLEPGVPSRAWRLSDTGRAQCVPLADQIAVYRPVAIAASAEPKATETAQIVAHHLGLSVEILDALHENDRTDLGWLGAEELEVRIARFFAEPGRRVMGNETADQAHARFAAAITDVCARHPDGNVVVVAHGTVITLFVARPAGVAPFPFWKRLGLPAFVALSLPNYTVQAVVDRIGTDE